MTRPAGAAGAAVGAGARAPRRGGLAAGALAAVGLLAAPCLGACRDDATGRHAEGAASHGGVRADTAASDDTPRRPPGAGEAHGYCNEGPGCGEPPLDPQPKKCDRGGPFPAATVTTACGNTVQVRRDPADPLVMARARIEGKWPSFRAAKDLDYDDDDDGVNDAWETCWREGHAQANLVGFGVSLTHASWDPLGGCNDPAWIARHAHNDPDEPSLLFFEKNDGARSTWQVIGAGYFYHYNPCHVPCLRGVPADGVIIHEAGWHRVPGDGGFDCVRQQWIDEDGGVPVADVADQCATIEPADFHRPLINISFGANKHARMWTAHVFFEPDTSGVAVATTDPWCRDSDDPDDPDVAGVDCPETAAFYPLTQTCECD